MFQPAAAAVLWATFCSAKSVSATGLSSYATQLADYVPHANYVQLDHKALADYEPKYSTSYQPKYHSEDYHVSLLGPHPK